MSIVVGIDLGTTNSCVAIPADADIPDQDALVQARRLRPLGGALIVAGPDLALTTPSAVWIAPDGTPLVGALAKRKARLPGAPPAMFFKRNMGADQPVPAGHATLTPLQASVHVLRHLKTMAEDTLGVPVDRAVITVPAFFETSAKTQTADAGVRAGLEVVETLMEPVAAALAYMAERRPPEEDPAGSRRFLVYDLGGGTFDTSVVTWAPPEGFTSRSFDGDRYLGGYDFDQAIVDWMISQLPAYDLRFDPGSPGDSELLARLLVLAEAAKHELSREAETEIISQDIDDRAGRPMNINLPISRRLFEQMIEPYVRGTLDNCAEAIAKARLAPADLDEIVLVGGSSRIPLVAALLRERFGIAPRLANPELAIAVGAALKAGTARARSGLLEIEKPVPDGSAVDIAGYVLSTPELASAAEVVVVLRAPDDSELREDVTGAGETLPFLFTDVPLSGDGEHSFTVLVLADGREVAAERVTVGPGRQAVAPDLAGDILAHDFSVELLDRQLARVVTAGTRIPHRAYQRLRTATRGSTLTVRLYEGWIPIGAVKIKDLPEDIEPGSGVELTFEFRPDWTIHVSVRLPDRDRAADAVLEIPVRAVAPWTEIRTRTAAARTQWTQVRGEVHRAEAVRAAPDLDRRLSALDILTTREQDQAKAHHLLLETETILQGLLLSNGPEDYLEPPRPDFESHLAQLQDLILLVERDDPSAAQPFRARQAELEQQGRDAFDAGDHVTWPRVNQRLDDLLQEVSQIPSIREILIVQGTPVQIRRWLHEEIGTTDEAIRRRHDELRQDARLDAEDKVKLPRQRDNFLAELTDIAFAVDEVALERASSREQLRNIYLGRLRPLREKITRWGRETGIRTL